MPAEEPTFQLPDESPSLAGSVQPVRARAPVDSGTHGGSSWKQDTKSARSAAPPAHYEHFKILRFEDGSPWELGRGAMGTTYKALDTRLHHHVPPKVISAGLTGYPAALRQGLGEQFAFLNQALARDPRFVLAFCAIAESHDEISDEMDGATPEEKAVDHRMLAEIALEKARLIRPDEGLLHLAQVHHFLFTKGANEEAQIEIDLARRSLPNNADVEQMAGLIARAARHWDEAVRCFERAYALQPHETGILTPLSRAYRVMRRYPQADAISAKLLALRTGPNGLYDRLLRATIPLEENADVVPLRTALAAATPDDDMDYLVLYRLILAFCTHDPDAVTRTLPEVPAGHPIRYQGVDYPKAWFEGVAARMRGDDAAAHAAFAQARAEIEPVVRADLSDARTLSLLAVTDAGLGHEDDAVREARRACEIADQEKGPIKAPTAGCQLAVVYAWLGQRDLAFAVLDGLVGNPAGTVLLDQPTYGDFKLNAVWDPIRGDPRFAALLEKLAPKPAR